MKSTIAVIKLENTCRTNNVHLNYKQICNYKLAELSNCCWHNNVEKIPIMHFGTLPEIPEKKKKTRGVYHIFCKGKFSLVVCQGQPSAQKDKNTSMKWTSFSPVVKVSILCENGRVGIVFCSALPNALK